METRAHHVLIGAFTIGAFLLALAFVLWMSKTGVDKRYADYDIVFSEAVTGLSVGGLVQYNGIKVGEVRELHLATDDPRKVIARVRLDANAPVRQDTRAKLALQGVTGLAFIQLSGGAPSSPPLLPTREQPVPVIPSEESALSKLLASGSDIVVTANDLLLRMHPRAFFPAAQRLSLEANIAEVLAFGASSFEAPLLTRDGREIPYFFTGKRIEFDGHRCLISIGIDVSERVRAEREHEVSERRFRTLFDCAPDGILVADTDSVYLEANESACRMR